MFGLVNGIHDDESVNAVANLIALLKEYRSHVKVPRKIPIKPSDVGLEENHEFLIKHAKVVPTDGTIPNVAKSKAAGTQIEASKGVTLTNTSPLVSKEMTLTDVSPLSASKELALTDIPSSALASNLSPAVTTAPETKSTLGVRGLRNLGNTCYMNSSLQCLSSCEPLTIYYLHGVFSDNLNIFNPSSSGGEISEAYAGLLKDLWRELGVKSPPVNPSSFRKKFIAQESQFNNFRQHDSQEFMIKFLDMLHEDINTVTEKLDSPRIEPVGLSDKEAADLQWWQNKNERGNSFILDLFGGQLRQVVQCGCGRSVAFDDFNQLTLQFPPSPKKVDIVLVRGLQVIQAQAEGDTVGDLFQPIRVLYDIPESLLVATTVFNNNLEILEADVLISTVRGKIHIYTAEETPYRFINFKVDKSTPKITNLLAFPYLITSSTDSDLKIQVQKLLQTKIAGLGMQKFFKEIKWDNNVTLESKGILTTVKFTSSFLELDRREQFGRLLVSGLEEHHHGHKIEIPNQPITLDDILRFYVDPERMEYRCMGCDKSVPASKMLDLWRLPRHLIIHLSRFSRDSLDSGPEFDFKGQKLTTRVDFPIEGLDLSPYTSGPQDVPPVYDLYAISMHHGVIGGGHYTAITKNFNDKQWYDFDDFIARRIDPSLLTAPSTRSAVYYLFYEQREPASDKGA
jgi:ubiquitin C-terminal hydrolase